MANPVLSLNENFMYNSMLARALLQLVTVSEKQIIQTWLEKMHMMDETPEEMTIRNEYMWFLLLQLQNKRITIPFNKIPVSHKLRPLKDVTPYQIYEEVLMSTDTSMSYMETDHTECNQEAETKTPQMSYPPCCFLQNQPIPRNGIVCYFAAFSDQNY